MYLRVRTFGQLAEIALHEAFAHGFHAPRQSRCGQLLPHVTPHAQAEVLPPKLFHGVG